MSERRSLHLQQLLAHISDDGEDLIHRLRALDQDCSRIQSFYHLYDYDPETPVNGFRSFVRIVDLFFESMASACESHPSPQLIRDCDSLSHLLTIDAKAAALIYENGPDVDMRVLELLTTIKPEYLEPMFDKRAIGGPFNIRPDFRDTCLSGVHVLHFLISPSYSERMRMLVSSSFQRRHESETAVRMPLSVGLRMRNVNSWPLSWIVGLINKPVAGVGAKKIHVPLAKSEWHIVFEMPGGPAVVEQRPTPGAHPPLECMLLTPSPESVSKHNHPDKSLILHIPGGGFFVSLNSVYTGFMSRVVDHLAVPILIPDYVKAPEHPFPGALQQLLQLYLYLTSGDDDVLQLIGFHPERILVSGDSAGGHLSLCLTIALNDLRRRGVKINLMPHALSLHFPAATIAFSPLSPGMILTGVDISTTAGELRLSVASYAHPLVWTDEEPEADRLKRVEKLLSLPASHPEWTEFASKLKERPVDPLFDPLIYAHFEDLKDIPMTILACEMDSLVDHSVRIAKAWRGRVTLDVAWGLPHGFAAEYKDPAVGPEVRTMIRHLAQGLEIDWQEQP